MMYLNNVDVSCSNSIGNQQLKSLYGDGIYNVVIKVSTNRANTYNNMVKWLVLHYMIEHYFFVASIISRIPILSIGWTIHLPYCSKTHWCRNLIVIFVRAHLLWKIILSKSFSLLYCNSFRTYKNIPEAQHVGFTCLYFKFILI